MALVWEKESLFYTRKKSDHIGDTEAHILHFLNAPDFSQLDCSDLVKFCVTGSLDELQNVMIMDINVVVHQLFGMTPLLLATYFGHQTIIEYLIKKGANVNVTVQRTCTRESAMAIAIFKGFSEVVALLVKNGFNLNEPCLSMVNDNICYIPHTPLYYAFSRKRLDPSSKLKIIETLIEASDEYDTAKFVRRYHLCENVIIRHELALIQVVIEKCGITPEELLMMASRFKKIDVVEYLMNEFGADANVIDKHGDSPYKVAVLQHNKEIVELMHKYGAVEENLLQELLLQAVNGEGFDDVRYYLDKGADPNIAADKHLSLFAAIDRGNVKIICLLLAYGAHDISDWHGYFPLHFAVFQERFECVKFLLGNGFNPRKESCATFNESRTFFPINLTLDLEIIKLLIHYGADINARSFPENQTILYRSVLNDEFELVKYLVEVQHIDVNPKDCIHMTPLHQSVEYSHMVKYLLDHGACINVQARDGLTPLHVAVVEGTVDALLVLLKSNPETNLQSNFGETPLHLAAFLNYAEKAEHLLDFNTKINLHDASGNTALHLASAKGNLEVAECLLKRDDVNIDLCNNDGATPLHLAAYNGHEKVMGCLLSKGASSSLTYHDTTAQQLCVKRGYFQLAQCFPEVVAKPIFPQSSFVDFMGKLIYVDGMGLCSYQNIIHEVLSFIRTILEQVGKKDPQFAGNIYLSGSVAEQCKLREPDEIDVILHLTGLSGYVQHIPIKESFGFCELKGKDLLEIPKEWDITCFYIDGKISPNKVRAKLIEHIEDVFHFGEVKNVPPFLLHYFTDFDYKCPLEKVIEEHKAGCILNFNCRYGIHTTHNLTIDIIPVLEIKDFPLHTHFTSSAEELIALKMVDAHENQTYLIPSAINSREEDFVWRYSTSHLEINIFINIADYQKRVYIMVKMLLKQFDNLEIDGKYYTMPSYFLKTLFFKELAMYPDQGDWLGCRIMERIKDIFQNLKLGVDTTIDSFFLEGHTIYNNKVYVSKERNVFSEMAAAIVSFLQSPINVAELSLNPRSLCQAMKEYFNFQKEF